MGQHFLTDAPTVQRILEAFAPRLTDRVLEIGPGQGVLTGPLLTSVHRLLAVELDPGLARALAHRHRGEKALQVEQADILTLDLSRLRDLLGRSPSGGIRVRVLGNLPYRIATAVLRRLLPHPRLISDLTVMVQEEVARRILARAGESAYGAFSVFIGLHARPRAVMTVPPGAFRPPPRVVSSVLRLDLPSPMRIQPADRTRAVALAEAAFSQRRKMLVNALGAAGHPPEQVARALLSRDIPPRARPQDLTPADYVAVARRLAPAGRAR